MAFVATIDAARARAFYWCGSESCSRAPDIDAAMERLRSGGVRFESFGLPEQDERGVCTADGTRVPWLQDPDGSASRPRSSEVVVSPIDTLFVDKGGVLIDNADDLGPQWRRLIGEFLAPRLGGRPRAWGEANEPAFQRQLERWHAAMERRGPADIRGFFANDARLWFLDMCDAMGVPRPPHEDAGRLAAETVSYVKAHLEIRAPRRGLEALRALRRRGVVLHIASGDAHEDLVAFLEQIGARELFDRVYGSDVVHTWKFGPEYYRAILSDSGVDPVRAAVVDDSAKALSWAGECGLRGFLVARRDGDSFDDAVTRALAEVSRALD